MPERRHPPERYPKDAAYIERLHGELPTVLADMEAYAQKEGEPITERPTARLLGLLVRASGARQALEIGTNIGYSAIHIAQALSDGGRLTVIDPDPDILAHARRNFEQAGVLSRIDIREGRGIDVLAELPGPYDFAYIDANKEDYPRYLDEVVKRLRPGGVVAIDNLLWQGHAADDEAEARAPRASTPIIREFNTRLVAHPNLYGDIVQVGDGLGIGVKKT